MSRILETPVLLPIAPFDPAFAYNMQFTYNDNQAVKNIAVITDNATGETAYREEAADNMSSSHLIPAHTLSPGHQYLAQIQVFDEDDNHSSLSDAVLFYCFTTPEFAFVNLSDGYNCKNANLTLELSYTQAEGETLKSLQFMKYSYDKTLLEASETLYPAAALSHSFYGLENNTTYYFRAVGETTHGFLLDTGYVAVNVSFHTIPANVLFQVENNYQNGYIQLQLNIRSIGYTLQNDSYTLADGRLTLHHNILTYHEGFCVTDDFCLFIEAEKLPQCTFLNAGDDAFSLSVVEVCGSYYCRMDLHNSRSALFVALPGVIPDAESGMLLLPDALTVFEVKRRNGIYNLSVYPHPQQINE
ncbi:MAG: hypothetical protein ACI4EQ_10675 [Lachnospiraceae bacterium]